MYRDTGRYVRSAIIAAPLALAVALFAPAPAFAQVTAETDDDGVTIRAQHPTPPPVGIVEQGTWTVTPALGFGFGGNLENSPLALGIATAYNWTPRVSVEGEFGYARSAQQGVLDPFTSGITTGNVNALYHFATENWAPYATIGLGFGHAHDAPDLVDANRTALMLNFGGGAKTALGERTNLRFDLRYYNGNDFVPSFWRPSVGLTFNLGPLR